MKDKIHKQTKAEFLKEWENIEGVVGMDGINAIDYIYSVEIWEILIRLCTNEISLFDAHNTICGIKKLNENNG